MAAVRRLLAQRQVAALLCAAVLLLKLLVPTGYMIGAEHGRVTIELCSGLAPAPMAMPGMHGHGPSQEHGKAEMPCAFAGLAAAAVAATDPVQLVALLAFIVAAGLVLAALPPPSSRTRCRPPLRGPPAAH